jgi:DNA polymerase
MVLNLDARQRAMLEAMGITVWLPAPEMPAAAEPQALETPAATAAPVPVREAMAREPEMPEPPAEAPVSPEPAAPRRTAPAPVPAPAAARQGSAARPPRNYVQHPAAGPAGEPGMGWRLGRPQPVYPDASGQPSAQGGWLILLEPPANPLPLSPAQKPGPGCAQTALEGDAARLLDNMLRALNLQKHPRVFSAALHRTPADAGQPAEPLQPALEALLKELRPDCVLVLGLASARAVLGRHDALGRLRAEPHRIAGVPTVVTYDPNYLLRAPQAKAGAWADLVQARGFAGPG